MSDVLDPTEKERITMVSPTVDVLSPTFSVTLNPRMEAMTPAELDFFYGLYAIVLDEAREKDRALFSTLVDQEVREMWEVRYWRRLLEGMILWEGD